MDTKIKTLQYRSRAEKTDNSSKCRGDADRRICGLRHLKIFTALLAVIAVAVSSVGIATVSFAAESEKEACTGIAAESEAEACTGIAAESEAEACTGIVTVSETEVGLNSDEEASENRTSEVLADETATDASGTYELDRFSLDLISELAERHEEYVREENRKALEAARGNAIETGNDLEEDMVLMLLSECDSEAVEAARAANEHAERIARAAATVPEGLTFTYNPAMSMELTDKEIEILERIVEAEATDEDVYGRMLVANVVINRVHSKHFASTVEKVVFQKIGGDTQFAPVSDGRYYSVKVTDLTREAVARVLDGEDYSCGALYFFQRNMTTRKRATWFDKHTEFLFKYGCHEFFKEY